MARVKRIPVLGVRQDWAEQGMLVRLDRPNLHIKSLYLKIPKKVQDQI
jgi:hypothetical protein